MLTTTVSRLLLGCMAVAMSMSFIGGANAQVRKRSVEDRIINSISSNELILTMRYFSARARLVTDNEAAREKILEAQMTEGTVYFFLSDCNGPGAFAQCTMVQPTLYYNGSGVTLSQLNDFNLDAGTVSTAGLLSDGRGVVYRKISLTGGVTASNLRLSIEEFLDDAEALLRSIDPSGAPSVRIPASAVTPQNSMLNLTLEEPIVVNSVGANSPKLYNFSDSNDPGRP